MAAVLLIVLSLLTPPLSCSGDPSSNFLLSPYVSPSLPTLRERSAEDGRLLLIGVINPQRKLLRRRHFKPTLQPSSAPESSPVYSVPVAVPTISPLPHRRGHHHHRRRPHIPAPSPLQGPGCDKVCDEPLTTTPFGSPCGCVLPMKVRLLLDVAPYAIFPVMNELEIEIAAGTYLEQSQVKIMGASADTQNQGRTIVDINLVPLGDKFDNTTATLIHERFWHRKVPLNVSLFGNYEMIAVDYTSIPSSPFYPSGMGSGPSANALPIYANIGSKNQKMDVKTIIIISLSAFVLLSVLVAALFLCLKWKKFGRPSSAVGPAFASSMKKRSGFGSTLSSSTASSASGSILSNMAPCMLSVKTFSLSEIENATNKFSSKQILGEGGFGRVYQGFMEDGTEVAVKLLTRDRNQDGDREFIAEVEMLSRLHHRNLVKLIGICIEGHKRCLVYEVVRNGSVESHLHGVDKAKAPLDWDSRLKIALGAARGLAYLHEDSNPRVIHRDFKASNVLLEDDFTPKVSDFGLAKEATEGSQHISTRVMGTFGYVAPEYAMTGHLLVKSDVYSYGVVLLELITGRKPVDMSQPQGQENLVSWARPLLSTQEGLEQLVDPALAGTYNFEDMAKVAAIASMCVHQEVTNRPFMGEVVQALKLIYNDAAGDDYCSQKDGSVLDSYSQGDLASWDATPRRKGHASSFITMDYSSGPLDDVENRGFSVSSFDGNGMFLPLKHGNRSGPLRTIRSKPAFYRLRGGSVSEHGVLLSKRSLWS